MKSILPILVLALLLLSCRKEQRKVNQIEGKWTVRIAEVEDFGDFEPNLVFNFDWCKVRFNDFCDFSAHDFDNDQTTYGTYSISDDGKELLLNLPGYNTTSFESFTIERLNFRTLILTNKNPNTSYYKQLRLRSMD
jgi:hypothetical protein